MSASVNKVTLLGYMGKDPDVRFTPGGQAVANFSLATDESYKNNEGEKVKKTEWHNLVVWGKSVEAFVQPYLHKGDLIYVEGKLQTRKWETKDGETKNTTEIVVTDIKGVQTGNAEAKPAAGSRESNSKARPTAQAAAQGNSRGATIADEDIPF
jgi:single-strand DNA-binding protein